MDCYMLFRRDCYIILDKPILLSGSLDKWGFCFATVDMSILPLHLDGDFVKIFPVGTKNAFCNCFLFEIGYIH